MIMYVPSSGLLVQYQANKLGRSQFLTKCSGARSEDVQIEHCIPGHFSHCLDSSKDLVKNVWVFEYLEDWAFNLIKYRGDFPW